MPIWSLAILLVLRSPNNLQIPCTGIIRRQVETFVGQRVVQNTILIGAALLQTQLLLQIAEEDAAPATYTEILDHFDTDTYNYGPVSVESGNLTAYLVTDSNDRLVNAVKTADRIFGKQTLSTPLRLQHFIIICC